MVLDQAESACVHIPKGIHSQYRILAVMRGITLQEVYRKSLEAYLKTVTREEFKAICKH